MNCFSVFNFILFKYSNLYVLTVQKVQQLKTTLFIM